MGLASTVVLAQSSSPAVPTSSSPVPAAVLRPTQHPPVARQASSLWLAPSSADRAAAASNSSLKSLQDGLRLYAQQRYDQAVTRFTAAAAAASPLREYGSYYAGVSELRLKRYESARRRFVELKDANGYIRQAAALGEAEADQGLQDYNAETKVYERLLKQKSIDEPAIWLSLATSSAAAGDRARAAEAYLHLYYEFPTEDLAEQALVPLGSLPEVQPIASGNRRYTLELGRGERMFGLRRIGDARTSFLRVQPFAKGDDSELIALRLAECDYFQGKYIQAREALKPYLAGSAREAEARFFYLMSQRGLKNYDSFELLTRALMKDFPDTTWAEDALNNLVTYYIVEKSDEEIATIVREQFERYPRGRYTERAAWKVGWFAYRAGNMKEAADYFERGAATFPRSDYRPAYLYWAGRAREQAGERASAIARWQLETADYLNTYYGKLAYAALLKMGAAPAGSNLIFARNLAARDGEDDDFPPNADTIRTLLAMDLYDPALKELEFATANWGDSPVLQATTAWINNRKSLSETGTARFNLARGAINIMKRAYPQYLASGGEQLPRELLTIIYPLSYWDLIKKYSTQNDLDPYLVAALMSQESTFVAEIRSSANAYGLTQLTPATARQYARKLKIKYSQRLLTNPDANVRIGTMYFADTIRNLGSVPLALASYNAGPTPVRRWKSQKPDLPQDEFIDDIPYPETQNYVKKILSTTEDYRRLYGTQ